MDPDKIQDLDEEMKANWWGIKNLLELDNTLIILNFIIILVGFLHQMNY